MGNLIATIGWMIPPGIGVSPWNRIAIPADFPAQKKEKKDGDFARMGGAIASAFARVSGKIATSPGRN